MRAEDLETIDREIDRITLGTVVEQHEARHQARQFTDILVAVDGSEGSAAPLAWAAWFGTHEDATVHLVTVIGPLPYTYDSGGIAPVRTGMASWRELMAEEREEAEELLRTARQRLADKGVNATVEVGVGSPASVVTAMAEQRGSDLIICGPNSGGAFERLVLGSVADGIKHQAHCAVLLAKRPPSDRRVLLPTDGSDISRVSTRTGARLAAALDADARILHVVPGSSRGNTDLSRRGYDEALRAAEEAGAARKAVGGLPDHVTSEVAFGPPHDVIVEQAERMEGGLIVMGSRGLGGITGKVLGSVSNPVSHRVKGSVLFIKP